MIIRTLIAFLASRPRRKPLTTIVLHSTAGSTFGGALSTLRLKGYSYHAIIEDQRDQDGEINKCVPDSRVAFHAGVSNGPDGPNVNDYSLGACFVNLNDGRDPVSKSQHEAMVERVVSWCTAYPSIKYLTTHYWIAPLRKSDPRNCPGFDITTFHVEVNRRLKAQGRNPIVLWRGR